MPLDKQAFESANMKDCYDLVNKYLDFCVKQSWDKNNIKKNFKEEFKDTSYRLNDNVVLGDKKYNNPNDNRSVPGGDNYKEFYFPIGDLNENNSFRFIKNKDYVFFTKEYHNVSPNFLCVQGDLINCQIFKTNFRLPGNLPNSNKDLENNYFEVCPVNNNNKLNNPLPKSVLLSSFAKGKFYYRTFGKNEHILKIRKCA